MIKLIIKVQNGFFKYLNPCFVIQCTLNAGCFFFYQFCLQGKAENNSNLRPKPAFKSLFEPNKKEIGKHYE